MIEYQFFRDGKYISTHPVSETSRETLIADMVGREMGETFPDLGHINEEKILEVSHVSNRRLKDVSLVLRKGEILRIGGLVGAGRTNFSGRSTGTDEITEGEIILKGKKINITSPAVALEKQYCSFAGGQETAGCNYGDVHRT